MNTKASKNLPSPFVRTDAARDRERLMFFAAAGLLFSLVVITLVVFNFRTDASAKQNMASTDVPPPTAIGTVTLYTPDRFVRAGTKLSDVRFKEIYWPRSQVPDEAIRDLAELKEFYAKEDIEPGIPLKRASLTKEPAGYVLPLTPGNRAVTIDIDATSGLEGHAQPGTRVDIVLTYHSAGELTSKVIVQNARVLSIGGEKGAITDRILVNRQRMDSKTITLDVTPGDALKIQTSRQLGRLSLLLRAPDDVAPYRTTEVDQNAIDGGDKAAQQKQKGATCKRGTMRMDGKEYILDCDGSISQLVSQSEP